jgi:hypothetical protein
VRQVPLPKLIEGQQPTAFTPQTGRHAPEEGPTPGAVEVRLGLCLNAHETDHRSVPPFLPPKRTWLMDSIVLAKPDMIVPD